MSDEKYAFPDMWVEEGKVYFDFGTLVVILVKDQPIKPYVVDGVCYAEVFAGN